MFKSPQSLRILRKSIRYPRITIKPINMNGAEIIVSVPLNFTQQQTHDFINIHSQWTNRTLERLERQFENLDSVLKAHNDEILLFGEWQPKSGLQNKALKRGYKHLMPYFDLMLTTYINTRLPQLSDYMGLQYTQVKITKTYSRFGSCTRDNRLFFSLMLSFAPKELIDYVIIHELAHIRHKNHSSAFWGLVGLYCDDYKIKRKHLKEMARIFPALFERLS